MATKKSPKKQEKKKGSAAARTAKRVVGTTAKAVDEFIDEMDDFAAEKKEKHKSLNPKKVGNWIKKNPFKAAAAAAATGWFFGKLFGRRKK